MKKEKDEASQQAPRPDRGRDRAARARDTPTSRRSGRPRRRRSQGIAHIKEEIDKHRAARSRSSSARATVNKVAELQYGKLPELESAAQGSAGHARPSKAQGEAAAAAAHAGRRRGDRRGRVARDRHPGVQDDAGRARQAAADGRQAARARGRPGRGDRRGVRRDPPLARGPVRSEPAERLVPVPRPHRRRQDRAVQGAGRVPVRQRGAR